VGHVGVAGRHGVSLVAAGEGERPAATTGLGVRTANLARVASVGIPGASWLGGYGDRLDFAVDGHSATDPEDTFRRFLALEWAAGVRQLEADPPRLGGQVLTGNGPSPSGGACGSDRRGSGQTANGGGGVRRDAQQRGDRRPVLRNKLAPALSLRAVAAGVKGGEARRRG
jgi:hypothetical protein